MEDIEYELMVLTRGSQDIILATSERVPREAVEDALMGARDEQLIVPGIHKYRAKCSIVDNEVMFSMVESDYCADLSNDEMAGLNSGNLEGWYWYGIHNRV